MGFTCFARYLVHIGAYPPGTKMGTLEKVGRGFPCCSGNMKKRVGGLEIHRLRGASHPSHFGSCSWELLLLQLPATF